MAQCGLVLVLARMALASNSIETRDPKPLNTKPLSPKPLLLSLITTTNSRILASICSCHRCKVRAREARF